MNKARHDKMASLVERMLELHKRNPRTPQEKESLSKYRMQEGGAMFGMNVIPLNEGEIKVGMIVEVLE